MGIVYLIVTLYIKQIPEGVNYMTKVDRGMEDGGVDNTVINRRRHKMGQMADFPPLLASSMFDFYKQETPQLKSQTMQHTLMNLVNTTLSKKYVDP